MSEEKNKKTVSMYDLADELLPRQQWCIGTDEVAEQLADLIVEHGCAVRYDKETKPQIDAAVLCDPYDEEEVLRDRLNRLRDGEWIILLHQRGYPIKPDGIGHFMKDIVDRMIIRTKRNN